MKKYNIKIAYRLKFSDDDLPEGTTVENFANVKTSIFQYLPHGINVGDEISDIGDLSNRVKYEISSYISFYSKRFVKAKKQILLKDSSGNVKFIAFPIGNAYDEIEEYSYDRQENRLSCTALILLEKMILWGDLDKDVLFVSKPDNSTGIVKIKYDDTIKILELEEIIEHNN